MSLFEIHTFRKVLVYTAVLCLLPVLVLFAAADTNEDSPVLSCESKNGGPEKLLGDESDGSRAIPVHLIDLLDEEGQKITTDDELVLPFSTRRSCGAECHSVETISKGWHFNAVDANVAPGRAGQPWILVDAGTGTQIPLSYRLWPGTFRPEQLGLTPWQFVQLFGRQMPGGGAGELESDNPDEIMRGFVSGRLEVNCLSCHNASSAHDQAEYAVQIARQNFRWAAAASSGFASVSGSAKKMPDTYDHLMPGVLDDPTLIRPTVKYRENTFDHKGRVFFDIVREVPAERCYFCHSNIDLNKDKAEKWQSDEDVHLAAGLSCVDCHRNGLDHDITRGYESEASVSANRLAATSSCRGCHLGVDPKLSEEPLGPREESSIPTAGRLGAPLPEHPGIPPVHFDKLACTACHCGPWPVRKTYRTKTSRAHGLGLYNIDKSDDVLPHIIYPVFARQPDGKIAPHKLFWPAFWGRLAGRDVAPIVLEIVRRTAGKIIADKKLLRLGDWPSLTVEHITEVLALLSSQQLIEGKAVYICGGKLYRLDDSGQLSEEENHPAAQPYLWPIAHDVRPAAQSLGVRRCEDCHSTDAPFSFGEVAVDSPVVRERDSVKKMVEFQDVDAVYMKLFAMSFVFRPWLKVVTLGSCAVLAAVLILYALKALACVLRVLGQED